MICLAKYAGNLMRFLFSLVAGVLVGWLVPLRAADLKTATRFSDLDGNFYHGAGPHASLSRIDDWPLTTTAPQTK